jgi:hypothetical protein
MANVDCVARAPSPACGAEGGKPRHSSRVFLSALTVELLFVEGCEFAGLQMPQDEHGLGSRHGLVLLEGSRGRGRPRHIEILLVVMIVTPGPILFLLIVV